MNRLSALPLLAAAAVFSSQYAIAAGNPCPQAAHTSVPSGTDNLAYQNNVGAQGTCNLIITVAANGTVSTAIANTAPYDGVEDQLIGVVNNSSGTITAVTVSNATSTDPIFALDGDGICAYQPFVTNSMPCNDDSQHYLGSASSFSAIAADQRTGTVNFSPGIPPGGTGYFSLEAPASLATVVTITLPPNFTKSFTPSTVAVGGSSTLSFSLSNPNASTSLTGIAFTDSLPAGVVVATPNGLTGSCGGGTITATAGSGTVSLSGATLAHGASCTFSVTVIGATIGVKNNSVTASSSGPTTPPATATLTVIMLATPPTITKAFGVTALLPNATTSLTFSIANPNATAITGLAFSDTLPGGLLVSNPNGLTGSCGGGTITAVAGTNTISLTGATLAGGASCTFSVNVTAGPNEVGLVTNTTSTVTSNNAGPGAPATATLFIGDAYQVSYAANLPSVDSYVDITNSGAAGASLQSGTSAAITGSFCANIYVFSPDEQMAACCSCPVTPNGLDSLSAVKDLIVNPLTRATPTSIVIKLVATVPVGGSCNNSAMAVGTATLSTGLAAWSTTGHATTRAVEGGSGFALTEKPFTPSNLSASELARLASVCSFIGAQGSGFGICNSCRLGGLGAANQ